jgi:hypothetical protein
MASVRGSDCGDELDRVEGWDLRGPERGRQGLELSIGGRYTVSGPKEESFRFNSPRYTSDTCE